MPSPNPIRFAFFGSSRFSVIVLDELERVGLMPACIVTTPDKPKGRKLALTPTPVKEWGLARHIAVYDPAQLDADAVAQLSKEACDAFIVASYGKIIPESIIDIPLRKTLNVHPSLLPRYRGASPLQSAMLDDTKSTGVTIMRINEKMDEGPIVAQQKVSVDEWPPYEEFEEMMAIEGGRLLAQILPDWIAAKIPETEQDRAAATYTKKTVKEDGLLDPADIKPDAPADRAYLAFRKIQAYHEWPGAYFFIKRAGVEDQGGKDGHGGKDIRIKISRASFADGRLGIEKVIPEGGKEMSYADFLNGYRAAIYRAAL